MIPAGLFCMGLFGFEWDLFGFGRRIAVALFPSGKRYPTLVRILESLMKVMVKLTGQVLSIR